MTLLTKTHFEVPFYASKHFTFSFLFVQNNNGLLFFGVEVYSYCKIFAYGNTNFIVNNIFPIPSQQHAYIPTVLHSCD